MEANQDFSQQKNATTDLTNTNSGKKKSSISETGHYKNIVNFKTLKIYVKSKIDQYFPQKDTLKLPNIEIILSKATDIHNTKMFNSEFIGFKFFGFIKAIVWRIIIFIETINF